MKKILEILMLIFFLMFIAGCTQTIEEVKTEENIGEIVSVKGTVESTIKFGDLSGYTLVDGNGDKIGVASKSLPVEGETFTVTGKLMKALLIGYYIEVE
jgi:hypothetical protein